MKEPAAAAPAVPTERVPGPLPVWYPLVLLSLQVVALAPLDGLSLSSEARWSWLLGSMLVVVLVLYALELHVHRQLGVRRSLQFQPAVLVPGLVFLVVACAVLGVVKRVLDAGSGFGLAWSVTGVLAGGIVVLGAQLEHRLVRRRTAREIDPRSGAERRG